MLFIFYRTQGVFTVEKQKQTQEQLQTKKLP